MSDDVDTLLANADSAMYEGKRSREAGKVRFFTRAVHGEWRLSRRRRSRSTAR